jgi:hypothetical protein
MMVWQGCQQWICLYGEVFSVFWTFQPSLIAHTSTNALAYASMSLDWQGHMAKLASNEH